MIEFDYDIGEEVLQNAVFKRATSLDAISKELSLSEFVISRAKEAIALTGQSPIVVLSRLGMVADEDICKALSKLNNIAIAKPEDFPRIAIDCEDISPIFLAANLILPLSMDAENLYIAMADPLNEVAIEALRFAIEPREILIKLMPIGEIERSLRALYDSALLDNDSESSAATRASFQSSDAEVLKNLAREEPIVRLLDSLLAEAIEAKATDIHIESKQNNVSIRMRVDGKLRPLPSLGVESGPPLISRLKILADLDVANSRSPQDGRASINNRGRPIDIRVSTVPAAFGESVAVRILDRAAVSLKFEDLGIVGDVQNTLRALITRSYGLTIITGPTGSGKTTTLYAALNLIKDSRLKILTIEDPIEFRFEEVNQVQVNNAAGVSFASALRSFLRQDPDIILVGEIRDAETAQIAVQAALTGHLVLATLHTNDAASASSRLIDMGVEPYLLASVLNGVAAQRLVRRLCEHCKEPTSLISSQMKVLSELGIDSDLLGSAFSTAKGCKECAGTGFRGRIALIEAFETDEAIRRSIHDLKSLEDLRQSIIGRGMKSLIQDGVIKAKQKLTSIDEVIVATASISIDELGVRP